MPPRPLEQPLHPRTFLVLLALHHGAQHGYGIKKAILELSEATVDLDAGGLYRLIARLETGGYLEAIPEEQRHQGEDSRRNCYRLTRLGSQALRDEAERLTRLISLPTVAALAGS